MAKLRACLLCSIVRTGIEFRDNGCPNCEDILELTENSEAVTECTSADFDGLIALLQPKKSWVAKWQRIANHIPGVYAVRVSGELPERVIRALEDRGLAYHPRDQVES